VPDYVVKSMQTDFDLTGPFEARYLAFLETVSQIRPRLHRYCARMTGSVLDGEEIVQDALFEAYRKLARWNQKWPASPRLLGSLRAVSLRASLVETGNREKKPSGLGIRCAVRIATVYAGRNSGCSLCAVYSLLKLQPREHILS
jgi:hypothetical protein